jgi:hypothetical protein
VPSVLSGEYDEDFDVEERNEDSQKKDEPTDFRPNSASQAISEDQHPKQLVRRDSSSSIEDEGDDDTQTLKLSFGYQDLTALRTSLENSTTLSNLLKVKKTNSSFENSTITITEYGIVISLSSNQT